MSHEETSWEKRHCMRDVAECETSRRRDVAGGDAAIDTLQEDSSQGEMSWEEAVQGETSERDVVIEMSQEVRLCGRRCCKERRHEERCRERDVVIENRDVAEGDVARRDVAGGDIAGGDIARRDIIVRRDVSIETSQEETLQEETLRECRGR